MSPLGPDTRSLLAAARGARPTSAAKARVDARLAATLGVAVAVSVPVAVAPAVVAAPMAAAAPMVAAPMVAAPMVAVPLLGGGAVFGVKGVLLAAALVVGAGAVVVRSVVPSGAPSEAPSTNASLVVASAPILGDEPVSAAPTPPAGAAAAEPAMSAPSAPSAEPSSSPVAVRASPRASTASSSGPLRRDSAVITQALRSLRDGDPDAALRAIDSLGSAQPTGPLAEERLAARVLALCAAGRTDEAKAAAADFLARFPSSVQSSQVRASCAR